MSADPTPTTPPARALLVGLLAATLPALYTGIAHGLSADPLLRVWLAGGVVPGRMLAEPWRLVTAPLLHLDAAHLAVNGILLIILGAASAARLGPLRAALLAVFSAWIGCTASALSAQGWAAGASGAVFGLLGALTVQLLRDRRRGAIWLALLAGSLWWAVPADKAAHMGGLLGGALLVLVPLAGRPARIVGGLVAAAALAGLIGVVHHAVTADAVPTRWVERDGLAVPAGWTPGVPIPPCATAWTDGLSTLCLTPQAPAPQAPAPETPTPLPGVVAHPLPDGRHLLTHAVSDAARALRAPLFAAARQRMKIDAPAPSAGPRN